MTIHDDEDAPSIQTARTTTGAADGGNTEAMAVHRPRMHFPISSPRRALLRSCVGSWQVQIVNPFGMVGQAMAAIHRPEHFFRGQIPTPMGMETVEGQWQLSPMNQLDHAGPSVAGISGDALLDAMIQLSQTGPYQLAGLHQRGRADNLAEGRLAGESFLSIRGRCSAPGSRPRIYTLAACKEAANFCFKSAAICCP